MSSQLEVRVATHADEKSLLRLQLELGDHHRELEPHNPRYEVDAHEWRRLINLTLQRDDEKMLVAIVDGVGLGVREACLSP